MWFWYLRHLQSFVEGSTRLIGGLPGFYVLENVWFRNDTFRKSTRLIIGLTVVDLFDPSPDSLPARDEMLSGRTNMIHHLEPGLVQVPDVWLEGTSRESHGDCLALNG